MYGSLTHIHTDTDRHRQDQSVTFEKGKKTLCLKNGRDNVRAVQCISVLLSPSCEPDHLVLHIIIINMQIDRHAISHCSMSRTIDSRVIVRLIKKPYMLVLCNNERRKKLIGNKNSTYVFV